MATGTQASGQARPLARVGFLALIPALALGLTACSPSEEGLGQVASLDCVLPTGAVSIAGASRANLPALGDPMSSAVVTAVDHAVTSGSYLSVYDTDAVPTRLAGETLTTTSKNDIARADDRKRLRAAVLAEIASARATDPGSDPLAALDMAARDVRSHGPAGTVVLLDSGLQTSGALRYQSGDLLLASGKDLVTHLGGQRLLPDLTGLTVILGGLGQTAAPQPKLDMASVARLEEQWTSIVEAAGASCVHLDQHPMTAAGPADALPVDVVTVPKPPQLRLAAAKPVALREDSVGFKDNSADLRDAKAAAKSVEAIARQIIDGGHRVLLTGTTATAGTETGRRELSLQRAEAVKSLLMDAGVPAEHVTTRGVGIKHAAHVEDLDAKGNLIPARAVRNRAVFVSLA